MEQRLPGLQVTGIDPAGEQPLVNARDLLREKGRVAAIVVDAGRAQDDGLLGNDHRLLARAGDDDGID